MSEANKPLRVFVAGNFGTANIGNEATLASMVASLRRIAPGCEIIAVCRDPQRAESMHGVRAVAIAPPSNRGIAFRILNRLLLRLPIALSMFASALRTLRTGSLLVVPGTGALDDQGQSPSDMPLKLATWVQAARVRAMPICFVSVGAGPIRHPVSRWLLARAARQASYRSYRDQGSLDFMAGRGVPARADHVFPDLVLGDRFSAEPPDLKISPLTIGLGVMTYNGWLSERAGAAIYDDYIDRMTALAHALLDRGHRIHLLIGERVDRRACADLKSRLDKLGQGLSDLIDAPEIETMHDLFRAIARTQIVIATRYHNVVAAVHLLRPTISLGYAQKNDELLAEAGLGAYGHRAETFKVATVLAQLDDMIAKSPAIVGQLRQLRERHMRAFDRQEGLLLQFVAATAGASGTTAAVAP